MNKDFKSGKVKRLPIKNLNLPNFVNNSLGNNSKVNFVEGTNVIRVPFGKRFPKKQRPDKNQNIATLILPINTFINPCLLYTSPSPRDGLLSRMPSSA